MESGAMKNRIEERNRQLREKGFEKTLNYACAINDIIQVKKKLENIKPTELNKKASYFGTALHIACDDNNIEIVKLLLTAGADLEIKDVAGNTALAITIERGYEDLAHLLIDAGADIHTLGTHRTTLIHLACLRCSRQMIEYLISKGLDVNALASDKRSALIYTTNNGGNIEAARVLIENGISSDHFSEAFKEACWRGNPDIAQLLLAHGADKNVIMGKTGKKPETLFWICNKGTYLDEIKKRYLSVIELLLANGFDFMSKYKFKGLIISYDGSPLDKAIDSGFTEAVKLIEGYKS